MGRGLGPNWWYLMVPKRDDHQDRVRDCPAHRMLRRRVFGGAMCWPTKIDGVFARVSSESSECVQTFHPDWRLVCACFLRQKTGLTGNYSSPLKWPKLIHCWKRLVPDPFFYLVQLSLGEILFFTGAEWLVLQMPSAAVFGPYFGPKLPKFGAGKVLGFMGKSTTQMVKPMV